MKRLLRSAGVPDPIVSLDGGEEAMAYLRAALEPGAGLSLPCVVFCDIKMPVQNGFDLLTWIRRQEAFRTLPFVMLTGGDVPSDRKLARELGANHFLVKYPSAAVLKQVIDEVCGNEPADG